MNISARRIRKGLFEIVGLTCECGGILQIESHKADGKPLSVEQEWKWETFCTKCKSCDPEGWPTLVDCLLNARAYFNASLVGGKDQ